MKRRWHLIKAMNADRVLIHREAAPIGLPVIEWFIAKVFRKKVIYDFDDAIWLTDKEYESFLSNVIRNRSKIKYLIRWAWVVTCGNEYLATYARKYNDNVMVVPTGISDRYLKTPIKEHVDDVSVIIGWTGTHSTLKYLDPIIPIIKEINKNHKIEFRVICNKDPRYDIDCYNFVPWKMVSEVDDLMHFDIGIMPMPNNGWTRGKCGFKAIQYFSLGIPAVISHVGINEILLSDNKNGFLAASPKEFKYYLINLTLDVNKRREMGAHARNFINLNYSSKILIDKYLFALQRDI